ncbi:MAG: InlB B-repeat-containing protein, partial [Bacilli bacterium]|nr:InlB B-repeat-containing protein [Bacilli bacterium]
MDWDVANFNIDINETNYTCSLALKAKYELTKYKITYVLNGGTNSQSNPDTYTYESNNINLSNPTRSGYVFIEWTLNNEQVA